MGAATQLSFAEFFERCILLRASLPPPLPIATQLLDAATQDYSTHRCLQDVSTQFPLAEFSVRCIYPQDPSGGSVPPSTHDVICPTCSRPIPPLLLDAAVQTPSHSVASTDATTQLPLTEFFIGCIYSNDPLDRPRSPIGTLQCRQRLTSPTR